MSALFRLPFGTDVGRGSLVLLIALLTWSESSRAEWFESARPAPVRYEAPLVPVAVAIALAPNSLPILDYDGRYAQATPDLPRAVQRVVDAANRLQGKPYVWGGGHRYLYDRGYDCSGSVSYVLHEASLLPGPRLSQDFQSYGLPGPGRFITIFARGGHVFLSVCGLRFDTSDLGSGRGDGPRWRPTARNYQGYSLRHPPGL